MFSLFSRKSPPSATVSCLPNPCVAAKTKDQDLVSAVAERHKRLTGKEMVTTGSPGDFGPEYRSPDLSKCQNKSYDMGAIVRRFNRYSEALPSARAAQDVNDLGDDPGGHSKGKPCLTRLPDNAADLNRELGLRPNTITDSHLRNDKTGFRAAMYRDEATGKLILVARDTQKNSLVDWKTNTDNGQGRDTDQYAAMRKLSRALSAKKVPFDLAGYSKGGGLAQEGGLMSPNSKVFVFNSAGLPDASLARTANSSFASLEERTTAFSSEGDFLTYMNNTTDGKKQIDNARYLRSLLAEDSNWLAPSVDYRNPETHAKMAAARAAQHEALMMAEYGLPPDNATIQTASYTDTVFAKEKRDYISDLDLMIKNATASQKAGESIRLFPPVRANSSDTIPGSMGRLSRAMGAADDKPNLGKLKQHLMENVTGPMEDVAAADRKAMAKFLKECG